jgi:hypothetical protein
MIKASRENFCCHRNILTKLHGLTEHSMGHSVVVSCVLLLYCCCEHMTVVFCVLSHVTVSSVLNNSSCGRTNCDFSHFVREMSQYSVFYTQVKQRIVSTSCFINCCITVGFQMVIYFPFPLANYHLLPYSGKPCLHLNPILQTSANSKP